MLTFYHIIPYHQAVNILSHRIILSHYLILSSCPHYITIPSYRAVNILSHHLISLSCPHAIKSSHIIMLSLCSHHPISQRCLIKILSHQAVLILSLYDISLSCPHPTISHDSVTPSAVHPITLSHLIKSFCHIISSHQAAPILSDHPIPSN